MTGCEAREIQKRDSVKKMNKTPVPSEPSAEGMSMRVLWTVSEYVIPDGSALTEDQARQFLFKPLDIGESWITFDGRTCPNVSFIRKSVPARDYFKRTFAIEPEALGIPDDNVDIVTTDCNLPGFKEYVRLKDRRLIVRMDGVFFYFRPAVDH